MSDFGKDLGLVHEAAVTSREVWGGRVWDIWAALAHDKQFGAKVLELFMVHPNLAFRLVPTFDHDMLKGGWKKLEKDSPAQQGEFVSELAEFLKEGESYVSGDELEKRAKDQDDLAGQRELEAMLREQEKIPVAWRKFYLVGPKTVWVAQSGHHCVPCLCWNGSRWVLDFVWLDSGFNHGGRLVRSSKFSS